MTLPNLLTIMRIGISPIFLLLYLWHESFGISGVALPYFLIGLLVVSEVSDLCDGYLARRWNQVTDLGKILDPMADSVTRISVFLTFTLGPVELPLLLVFVFLYRDSIIGALRTVCALDGFALAARKSGKLKAVVQAVAAFAILILMIPYSLGALSGETLRVSALWIASAAALYTFLSGIEYFYANWEYVKRVAGGEVRS
jgi:CDP-diacylglycerol---glycerol-3-phosphate 3-phosphatidyltransferase